MSVLIKGIPYKKNDNRIIVTFMHFDYLDEINGVPEEDRADGYVVENIPEPLVPPNGKKSVLLYDTLTGDMEYDYSFDLPSPPTTLEELAEKLDLTIQLVLEIGGILWVK